MTQDFLIQFYSGETKLLFFVTVAFLIKGKLNDIHNHFLDDMRTGRGVNCNVTCTLEAPGQG